MMQNVTRRATVSRALISILLLVLSVLVFCALLFAGQVFADMYFPGWRTQKDPVRLRTNEPWLLIPLFLAPYLFAGIQVWRRPSLGIGTSLGLALAGLVGFVELWVMIFASVFPGGVPLDYPWGRSYRLALFSVPLNLCLVVVSTTGFFRLASGKRNFVQFVLSVVLVPFIVVPLNTVALLKLRWRVAAQNKEAYTNDHRASRRFVRMELCALRYAATKNEKEYPSELGQSGETNCRGLENSRVEAGYQYRYLPHRDETGIQDFWLEATPVRERFFPTGHLHMRTDETAVLRPGSIDGASYENLKLADSVYQCARYTWRSSGSRSSYPPDIASMLAIPAGKSRCVRMPDLAHESGFTADDRRIVWMGYVLEYRVIEDGRDFEITLRPQRYGEPTPDRINLGEIWPIRSYIVRSDGVVHATPFDRAATLQDPVAQLCEMRGDYECFNGPGGAMRFVRDSY